MDDAFNGFMSGFIREKGFDDLYEVFSDPAMGPKRAEVLRLVGENHGSRINYFSSEGVPMKSSGIRVDDIERGAECTRPSYRETQGCLRTLFDYNLLKRDVIFEGNNSVVYKLTERGMKFYRALSSYAAEKIVVA